MGGGTIDSIEKQSNGKLCGSKVSLEALELLKREK
jgi:hypothetical protein